MDKQKEFDVLTQPPSLQPPLAGRLLIEAGAGTGKTWNIQHLFLRLVLEGGLEVGQILVVTFTEAATAELRGRIRANLAAALGELETPSDGEGADTVRQILAQAVAMAGKNAVRLRLQKAVASFDEAAISTIHGFCSRVLREHAFESGSAFDLELLEDASELAAEVARDFFRQRFYPLDKEATAFGPESLALLADGLKPILFEKAARIFTQYPDARPVVSGDVTGETIRDHLQAISDFAKKEELANVKFESNRKLIARLACLDPEKNLPEIFAILLGKDKAYVTEAWKKSDSGRRHHQLLKDWSAWKACLLRDFHNYFVGQEAFRRLKRGRQVLSFEDLLIDLRNALRLEGPDGPLAGRLRQKYPAALVDEFQDTDPVQYEIFDRIYSEGRGLFVMIGDPKQSIYRFRGADIFTYLEAARKVGEDNRKTLTRNSRSTAELLARINRVFGIQKPFYLDGITHPDAAPREPLKQNLVVESDDASEHLPLQLLWFVGEKKSKAAMQKAVLQDMTARIVKLLNSVSRFVPAPSDPSGPLERRIEPCDIGVLVDRNDQAGEVYRALTKMGVPCIICRSGNVFGTDEATSLYHLLRAVREPGRPEVLKTALATPLLGWEDNRLLALGGEAEAADFSALTEVFLSLRDVWDARGVLPAASRLLSEDKLQASAGLARQERPERVFTNLYHLAEILHSQEKEAGFSPETLLRWFAERITEADKETNTKAYETRLETDEKALNILTVHKSKGLEFPIVFCPFLWTTSFKSRSDEFWACHASPHSREILIPLDETSRNDLVHQVESESLSELLRVAYVAVTRARHRCTLYFANANDHGGKDTGCKGSSLNYLLTEGRIGEERKSKAKDRSASPTTIAGLSKTYIEEPAAATPDHYQGLPVKVLSPDLVTVPVERYRPAAKAEELVEPVWAGRVPDDRGLLSYTSLLRHDWQRRGPRPGGENGDGPAAPGPSEPGLAETEIDRQDAEAEAGTFDRLPGGAVTGDCFHSLFEAVDYPRVLEPAWAEGEPEKTLLREALLRHGLLDRAEPAGWPLDEAGKLLENALRTEIRSGDDRFRMADIPRADRLAESPFYFVSPDRLDLPALDEAVAKVFRPAGAGEDKPGRAALRFSEQAAARAGFLTGTWDLLFRRGERYYFLDWKTDKLGGPVRYEPAALRQAMTEKGYSLQAGIYAVALDAYLARRLGAAYDPDRHFGGGLYLFVRGMAPGRGVFSLRPDREGLALLRAVLVGGGAQ